MSYSELDQAKHDTVEQHKGGAVALAPLIGVKSSTLSNKVNPNVDTHHLSLDEAVGIMAITQNYNMLKAAAAALDHAVVEMPTEKLAQNGDLELLDGCLILQKEMGEVAEAFRKAWEDGNIDSQDLKDIKREMYDVFSQGLAVINCLEAICDER